MQIIKKIRFIAYFSYLFAATQLAIFIGAIVRGVEFLNIAGSLLNVGIWCYIGYALIEKRQRNTYWITVAFLIYIVFNGLGTFVGFYFLLEAGAVNVKFAAVYTYSFIIFISSLTCLYLLTKKEVRSQFHPSIKTVS